MESTTYTGLATYGRISSIVSTSIIILIGVIFFVVSILTLTKSKVDPITGKYTEKVERNRRAAIAIMVIVVFVIIIACANLYFTLHSKEYAAVEGGVNIMSNLSNL